LDDDPIDRRLDQRARRGQPQYVSIGDAIHRHWDFEMNNITQLTSRIGLRPMLVALVLVTCFVDRVDSEEAYSSFGPNNSYQFFTEYGIGNNSSNAPNIHVACQFTSELSGDLESIDVAIGRASVIGSDNMEFNLWSDIGNEPGKLLWTGAVEPTEDGIWTIQAKKGERPALIQGATYWLSARAESGISQYGWNLNSRGIETNILFDPFGGKDWQTSNNTIQAAFRVNVMLYEPCGLANSVWPDYGGGARNTHRSPVVGFSGSPVVKWEFDLSEEFGGPVPYSLHHQPAVGEDGTLYFLANQYASRPPLAFAVSAQGRLEWTQMHDATQVSYGNWPAVNCGGRLFHASWRSGAADSGKIYARSILDGSLFWIWPFNASSNFLESQSGPTIAADGVVYSASDNGILTSMTADGDFRWYRDTEGSTFGINPGVAPNGDIVVGGKSVRSFDSNGNLKWSYNSSVGSYRSVTLTEEGVVFAGEVGFQNPDRLVALAPDGDELWTTGGIGGPTSQGPDGTLYAMSDDSIFSIDPLDGSINWSYPSGQVDEARVEGITIDSDGNLYFTTVEGNFVSLASNGNMRWSFDLAPQTTGDVHPGAPVIGPEGTIFVPGGFTNKLFAFNNYIVAREFNRIQGIHIGGDLNDSYDSDDSYLKFQIGTGSPLWVEFVGVLPTDNPEVLTVSMEASCSTLFLTQTVDMFNWKTQKFEQVDSRIASFNNDSIVTVDLTSSADDFVEPLTGAIRMLAGWRAKCPILSYPWIVCIDQVAWRISDLK
jgi:hypothetical protein